MPDIIIDLICNSFFISFKERDAAEWERLVKRKSTWVRN